MAIEAARPETSSAAKRPAGGFRHSRRILVALFVAVLLLFVFNRLGYELKSYALLTHFVDPQATGPLLRFETNPVTTEEV